MQGPDQHSGLQVSRCLPFAQGICGAVEKVAHLGSGTPTMEISFCRSGRHIQTEAHVLLGVFHYKLLFKGYVENKRRRNHLTFHNPEKTMVNIFAILSLRNFIL